MHGYNAGYEKKKQTRIVCPNNWLIVIAFYLDSKCYEKNWYGGKNQRFVLDESLICLLDIQIKIG